MHNYKYFSHVEQTSTEISRKNKKYLKHFRSMSTVLLKKHSNENGIFWENILDLVFVQNCPAVTAVIKTIHFDNTDYFVP